MPTTATQFPRLALIASMSHWCAWMVGPWHAPAWDADERLLGEARDLVDLERRQRRLERGREERFAPLAGLP